MFRILLYNVMSSNIEVVVLQKFREISLFYFPISGGG